MKTNLNLKKVWKKPSLAIHPRMLTESGSGVKCESLDGGTLSGC